MSGGGFVFWCECRRDPCRDRRAAMAYNPRDRFWQKAKQQGLRARSAFKLEEIQQRFRILRPGARVLDLGAAPGGWCQIAAREVGPKGFVLGVDLEPISRLPAPTVTWVADAFAPELLERLRGEGRAPYDAVLSDLAPKTSGVRGADEARSLELAGRALALSLQVLKPSGAFVVKVFMGGDFEVFLRECRRSFEKVRVVRPEASVARGSKEVYLVCQNPRRIQEAPATSDGSTSGSEAAKRGS
jgi:23S rRNA (uridine2552-2'-O)-methyltransferase